MLYFQLHCCGAMQPSDWAHSRLNSNDKSAVEVGISKTIGFYTLPATCCKSKDPDICDIHRKIKFAGHIFDGIHTEVWNFSFLCLISLGYFISDVNDVNKIF